jgi:hypothetical protein
MPLQREPSLWDLEADAFAAKEASDSYTVNVKGGVVTTDKPMTESLKQKMKDAFDEARVDPSWGGAQQIIEPQLSPDELVAVRQLIEERFGDQSSVAVVSPEATETPGGGVDHPSSPTAGPPTAQLMNTASSLRKLANGNLMQRGIRETLSGLACDLEDVADYLDPA